MLNERTASRDLPLRERKKLRVRQALAEKALELFGKKGFDATTLDELVDAVEVSKRTFFRNYASKEDVALAPERELWTAYLAALDASSPSGEKLLAVYTDALYAALDQMDEDWGRRFLASRKLVLATPGLAAQSLQYCADVTDAAVTRLDARLAATAATPMQLRLIVEVMIAAWHCALHEWSNAKGAPRAKELAACMRHVSAGIASTLELSARPRRATSASRNRSGGRAD